MGVRVALITGNYNYQTDGVALTMNRLVGHLGRHGVPVRVFAPVAARPAFPHEGVLVPVPSVPLPGIPYRLGVGLTPGVKRELRAFAPTVVHLCTPDVLGFAALRWARLRGIPVVTTFHTHFTSYFRFYRLGAIEPLGWWAVRQFYNRCHEVYVAAPSMGDVLRAKGVTVPLRDAPFGVDLGRFYPGRRNLEWRRARGLADDLPVVLFVGRLVWEKGLREFAATVNALRDAGGRFGTLVVGEGPAREGFEQLVPHAVFAGRLDGDELATAFASADVFLFPSASETFGCVTVEAMASGLPVVVADATGSRDIVRPDVDGVVCPTGDVPAFAAAVRRLIDAPAERERFRRAGLDRAKEFDWETVLGRMRAYYDEVVGVNGMVRG